MHERFLVLPIYQIEYAFEIFLKSIFKIIETKLLSYSSRFEFNKCLLRNSI